MSSNRQGRYAREAPSTSEVPSSAPGSAYRGPGIGAFDHVAHGYALQPTQYPASVIPYGQPTGPTVYGSQQLPNSALSNRGYPVQYDDSVNWRPPTQPQAGTVQQPSNWAVATTPYNQQASSSSQVDTVIDPILPPGSNVPTEASECRCCDMCVCHRRRPENSVACAFEFNLEPDQACKSCRESSRPCFRTGLSQKAIRRLKKKLGVPGTQTSKNTDKSYPWMDDMAREALDAGFPVFVASYRGSLDLTKAKPARNDSRVLHPDPSHPGYRPVNSYLAPPPGYMSQSDWSAPLPPDIQMGNVHHNAWPQFDSEIRPNNQGMAYPSSSNNVHPMSFGPGAPQFSQQRSNFPSSSQDLYQPQYLGPSSAPTGPPSRWGPDAVSRVIYPGFPGDDRPNDEIGPGQRGPGTDDQW